LCNDVREHWVVVVGYHQNKQIKVGYYVRFLHTGKLADEVFIITHDYDRLHTIHSTNNKKK